MYIIYVYREIYVVWKRRGDKKILDLGRIIFSNAVFAFHQILSSTQSFHVCFKEVFCERDGWVNIGEKCYQFFYPL